MTIMKICFVRLGCFCYVSFIVVLARYANKQATSKTIGFVKLSNLQFMPPCKVLKLTVNNSVYDLAKPFPFFLENMKNCILSALLKLV